MTSQAVVIDGSIYLIDAGYGTLMRMAELEMPLKKLKQVFITSACGSHNGSARSYGYCMVGRGCK